MANLSHSAKLGSDWTHTDLEAYNIVIQREDTATFFGTHPLPQPTVSAELLNNVNASNTSGKTWIHNLG
jgi:hypothetical protein